MKRVATILIAIIFLSGCTNKDKVVGERYNEMVTSFDTSKTYQFDTEIKLSLNINKNSSQIIQQGKHQLNVDTEQLLSTFETHVENENSKRTLYYKDDTYYYKNGSTQYAGSIEFQDIVEKSLIYPYYPLDLKNIIKEKTINESSSYGVVYTLDNDILTTEFLENATIQVLEGSNHQYKTFDKNSLTYEIIFNDESFPIQQTLSASGITIDNIPIEVTYEITNIINLEGLKIDFPENLTKFPLI